MLPSGRRARGAERGIWIFMPRAYFKKTPSPLPFAVTASYVNNSDEDEGYLDFFQ
eukprot:gene22056-28151_t